MNSKKSDRNGVAPFGVAAAEPGCPAGDREKRSVGFLVTFGGGVVQADEPPDVNRALRGKPIVFPVGPSAGERNARQHRVLERQGIRREAGARRMAQRGFLRTARRSTWKEGCRRASGRTSRDWTATPPRSSPTICRCSGAATVAAKKRLPALARTVSRRCPQVRQPGLVISTMQYCTEYC